MSKSFVIFVFVGAFAALVNWLSRFGFSVFFSLEISVIIAYLIGMSVAYVLNRRFVFESSGRAVVDEYVRFTVVNIVALVQVFLVTIILSRYVFPALNFGFFADAVAHAIGVASPIFTSFIGHKFFTFASKTSPNSHSDG